MSSSVLEYLAPLIAFRSIAGNTDSKRACITWLRDTFLSAHPERRKEGEVDGAPYLLIAHPKPKLLWFAHVDVVPGSDEQFTMETKGDRVLGRGVKDMKGAALCFLIAYQEAVERGEDPPVSILLTTDEEIGGSTIPMLLDEGILGHPPVAFTPDTGTSPCVVVAHKGVAWAELEVRGRSAHAAAPWEGSNPIPRLAEAIQLIAQAFPVAAEGEWGMTVTPTQLSGSDAQNRIPDAASCRLDIRFTAENAPSPQAAIEMIRAVLPPDCTLELRVSAGPLNTDPNHPLVQTMLRLATDVTGQQIEIGREHGASDARFFGEHGIPAFLHGPIGGGLHGADEWVSLQSLEHQIEISRRLLVELST